ncbi:MAG: dephospho-CoA kinase [Flavobacteriales bacterium]|nr:dephospho-CoA kinase [Flavobacteriales bacterium]
MLKVGLTGGIGAGKSTVARMFSVLGVPVFHADEEAKDLMNADPELRSAITERFGVKVYADNVLDRRALAAIVFNDVRALADLNAMVHPAVRRAFNRWSGEQTGSYVVMEAAILAEHDGYKAFDRVITVTCPEAMRIERVVQRDGVSVEEVRARLANQATDEERLRIADFVVANDDTQLVIPRVLAIHEELLRTASA